MFVGEAPGQAEDILGEPFIGASGQLLRDAIRWAGKGMKRIPVYITNVVACRPPQNRTPRKEEIAACEPRLNEILEKVNPEAVVLLGATAKRNTSLYRGRKVLELFHPAFVLRRGGRESSEWRRLKMELRVLFTGLSSSTATTLTSERSSPRGSPMKGRSEPPTA
jgi:DNA polymerase